MADRTVNFEAASVETAVIREDTLVLPAQTGVDLLVSDTRETFGLEWVDNAGIIGLDDEVTARLGPVLPKVCAQGPCRAEIVYDSGDTGENGSITVTCPTIALEGVKTKAAADRAEAERTKGCKGCQWQVAETLLDWLGKLPRAKSVADSQVEDARTRLKQAEERRTEIFELGSQS
jgi:hypothetical protein